MVRGRKGKAGIRDGWDYGGEPRRDKGGAMKPQMKDHICLKSWLNVTSFLKVAGKKKNTSDNRWGWASSSLQVSF